MSGESEVSVIIPDDGPRLPHVARPALLRTCQAMPSISPAKKIVASLSRWARFEFLIRLQCGLWLLLFASGHPAIGQEDALDVLGQAYRREIWPLIQTHCLSCHDAETQEAQLDLSRFPSMDQVRLHQGVWGIVMERVEAGEMPPEDAETPMSERDRASLLKWIKAVRHDDALRNAGDPGPVLARRLSHAEYDHSIRDLTGVDIRPTQTFPVDPANEAGFDNSGESLSMSPALVGKYLEAARMVANHLLLTPDGIRFAPHPVVTDTDRDKYCVKRIVEFYQRQPTDLEDYFFAAWRYQVSDRKSLTLDQVAADASISQPYLKCVWHALTDKDFNVGPMAALQWRWKQIPDDPGLARQACGDLARTVQQWRRPFEPHVENLSVEGIHKGAQAFVLWKNKQYAASRRKPDFGFLDQQEEVDPSLRPPDGDPQDYKESCERFCDVFPDAFYISERGRDYLGVPKEGQEKGRLLSAGFHSMMGYFRDDGPLYDLILDESGRRELDRLWEELDFICTAPRRQYQGMLWFERTDSGYLRDPQFDFARPENEQSLTQASIEQLAERYLKKASQNGGSGVALAAIQEYFAEINGRIRWVERAQRDAESIQLQALVDFAQRAFRRPLSAEERESFSRFYYQLRTELGLEHRQAIEDVLVAILMSPDFCFRLDLLSDTDQPRPLTDHELASRLSFFLWASVPDETLLRLADQGQLRSPEVLLEQVRRMLDDGRVRGMATEFAANWLDIRRFEEHNSVDRQRFPSFDERLRKAMFEEPIRFFVDVVQQDRSSLDFLYADDTWVNAELARHYGMDDLRFEAGGSWVRVDGAGRYGRGGLLTMAVFLTKNSPGLRTSPVKRGYWVVRRLLGERIPPPPPNVPELPTDESKLGELTLPEMLARHRDHQACAGCHNRFDSVGVIFEGYGPIGERRTNDLGGRPIVDRAVFPDQSRRRGVAELKDYLRDQREQEFLNNVSRKLLAYALGRTLQLSDDALVATMGQRSKADGNRFNTLVETIVTSPQFLNKRGRLVTGQPAASPISGNPTSTNPTSSSADDEVKRDEETDG